MSQFGEGRLSNPLSICIISVIMVYVSRAIVLFAEDLKNLMNSAKDRLAWIQQLPMFRDYHSLLNVW